MDGQAQRPVFEVVAEPPPIPFETGEHLEGRPLGDDLPRLAQARGDLLREQRKLFGHGFSAAIGRQLGLQIAQTSEHGLDLRRHLGQRYRWRGLFGRVGRKLGRGLRLCDGGDGENHRSKKT
ncbi:MAG TPA: hypothetical protein VGL11_05060 [Candidatus Binatia bacterium]